MAGFWQQHLFKKCYKDDEVSRWVKSFQTTYNLKDEFHDKALKSAVEKLRGLFNDESLSVDLKIWSDAEDPIEIVMIQKMTLGRQCLSA